MRTKSRAGRVDTVVFSDAEKTKWFTGIAQVSCRIKSRDVSRHDHGTVSWGIRGGVITQMRHGECRTTQSTSIADGSSA
jgi:hypothetical protein